MPTTRGVWRATFEQPPRLEARDVEVCLSGDVAFSHFLSHVSGTQINRATYFERCWPNSERTEGFDFIHLVPDGDRVFVTYEARAVAGGRFRNTEILTLRGGQIIDVEVYFGWSIPHDAKAGGFIAKD